MTDRPPGWLAKSLADNDIGIMMMRSPASHAGRGFDVSSIRARVTDTQRHRLFMCLDALFKSWAGESLIAFIVRRNSSPTKHEGRSDG